MRRLRNKFKRPKAPWYLPRIEEERKIMKEYGLRRKREIWSAQEILRKFRRRARELNAVQNKAEEKILLDKLKRLGLLGGDATLDDVLALTVYDILDRRLQTILFKKALVNTPLEARQKIVHGHVLVNGRKVKFPSYLVKADEENTIELLCKPQGDKK